MSMDHPTPPAHPVAVAGKVMDWKFVFSNLTPIVGLVAVFVTMQNDIKTLNKEIEKLQSENQQLGEARIRMSILETRLLPIEKRLEQIFDTLDRMASNNGRGNDRNENRSGNNRR